MLLGIRKIKMALNLSGVTSSVRRRNPALAGWVGFILFLLFAFPCYAVTDKTDSYPEDICNGDYPCWVTTQITKTELLADGWYMGVWCKNGVNFAVHSYFYRMIITSAEAGNFYVMLHFTTPNFISQIYTGGKTWIEYEGDLCPEGYPCFLTLMVTNIKPHPEDITKLLVEFENGLEVTIRNSCEKHIITDAASYPASVTLYVDWDYIRGVYSGR